MLTQDREGFLLLNAWQEVPQSAPVDFVIYAWQSKNLRAKLGDDPKHPRFIETVFGIGYRLAE